MKTTTRPSARTTTRTRAGSVAATVACLGLLLAGAAGPAAGGDDDDDDHGGGHDDDRVIQVGACRGGGEWKLKVKTDDGRLEVEGEVDTNRVGERWQWTIRHDGSVSARGVATTLAPSGSFDVERDIVDLAGTDTVVFRATSDGRVCRGVINY